MLGRVNGLLSSVSKLSGWRTALGLAGGVVLAGAAYHTRHPSRAADAFGLAMIVSMGWLAGMGWERSAAQARRRSVP